RQAAIEQSQPLAPVSVVDPVLCRELHSQRALNRAKRNLLGILSTPNRCGEECSVTDKLLFVNQLGSNVHPPNSLVHADHGGKLPAAERMRHGVLRENRSFPFSATATHLLAAE